MTTRRFECFLFVSAPPLMDRQTDATLDTRVSMRQYFFLYLEIKCGENCIGIKMKNTIKFITMYE